MAAESATASKRARSEGGPSSIPGPPKFFKYLGGAALFAVRAGPGARAAKEAREGECDLSYKREDVPTEETWVVQRQAARDLAACLFEGAAGVNKFAAQCGVTINAAPVRVIHDGAPKSVVSHKVLGETLRSLFPKGAVELVDDAVTIEDGELGATAADGPAAATAWLAAHGMNTTDRGNLQRVVYVCSTATSYRLNHFVGAHIPRITQAAGAIVTYTFPIGAAPNIGMGTGTFGFNCLGWANATRSEFAEATGEPLGEIPTE